MFMENYVSDTYHYKTICENICFVLHESQGIIVFGWEVCWFFSKNTTPFKHKSHLQKLKKHVFYLKKLNYLSSKHNLALWCVGGIRVELEFDPRVVNGWVEA